MVRGNSGDSSGWAKSMGRTLSGPTFATDSQPWTRLPKPKPNALFPKLCRTQALHEHHKVMQQWMARVEKQMQLLRDRLDSQIFHASEPRRLVQLNVSDSSFLAKLDHPSVGNREESASSMIIRDLEDFAGLSGSPWNPSQSSSYCSCL